MSSYINPFAIILFLLHTNYFMISESNTISTIRSIEEVPPSKGGCEDEFPQEFCDILQEGTDSDNCVESPYRDGCKRTCRLCERETDKNPEEVADEIVETSTVPDLNKGCEDKIPNCEDYITLCCQMKEAMNTSCEKTCKFCTETPSQEVPGSGGGNVIPPGSSSQDPCGSTNPPSVTVDAPSAPGQSTTTTLAPIVGGGLTTQSIG